MVPINFTVLSNKYLIGVFLWEAMENWFNKNINKRFIEVQILLRAMQKEKISGLDCLKAVEYMVAERMLEGVLRLRYDGDLLEGEYTNVNQIPVRVWLRNGYDKVKTSECETVTGFRWK